MLTVVMQVLGLIVNGLKLTGPEGGAAVVSIVISAGILYYIFRPHVKQAFGRT
jgi:energy-converting hydrogenase Eha subunit G